MKVLVTDHVFGDLDAERAALAEIGCELELAPDPAALPAAVAGAAGLMVCFAQVDEQVIEAASDCRIIARYGIGVDNVDVAAATRKGIQVTNVPDYCLDEVADHAMALLLAAARGVVGAALGVRSGDWAVPQENVHRIAGRRLALIGGGRIGRRVADRARAFGYEVVVYDPYADDSVASVEEAVSGADAVSLHAPLTDETRHIIGEQDAGRDASGGRSWSTPRAAGSSTWTRSRRRSTRTACRRWRSTSPSPSRCRTTTRCARTRGRSSRRTCPSTPRRRRPSSSAARSRRSCGR